MLDLYTMGERIRQAREDMGYTRETFSEMANITPRFCLFKLWYTVSASTLTHC